MNDWDPCYSPNGKKIVFTAYDTNDLEIYTIDADGGGKFNVTDNTTEDYSPSWGAVSRGSSSWADREECRRSDR
jgi:Tol biopolymer transport system component